MSILEKALHDPSGVFSHPSEVVKSKQFSLEEKIKILLQWEYDARDLEVAEEENMPGPEGETLLVDVLDAIHELSNEIDVEQSSPTKHGGTIYHEKKDPD